MQKYRLLKDLPGMEAGTLFYYDGRGTIWGNSSTTFSLLEAILGLVKLHINDTEWFEKVEERKSKLDPARRIVKDIKMLSAKKQRDIRLAMGWE
jgi:hypothetical protein